MIVEVIIDMGQFFFIFLVTVIAFGHAYYILFRNVHKIDEQDDLPMSVFDSLMLSYLNVLGELGHDTFE